MTQRFFSCCTLASQSVPSSRGVQPCQSMRLVFVTMSNHHTVKEHVISAHWKHRHDGSYFMPEHTRRSHTRLNAEERRAKEEADMEKIRLRRQQRAAGLI